MPKGKYIRTDKCKCNLSISKMGNRNPMFGKNISKEHKEKLRMLMVGNNRGFKKGYTPWSKGKRGKDSPNWKGGYKNPYIHYKNADYIEWRKRVFERDKYTCQMCGNKSKEGNPVVIHPHHKKSYTNYPKLRYVVDNGITLCIPCHHQTHFGH